jgi:hypothetical protein
MSLFATDFGAGSTFVFFLLIAWLVLLVLAAIGSIQGVRLLIRGSPRVRIYGLLLALGSLLIPLSCYFGPAQIFKLVYGSYPLGEYPTGKITPGMTTDQVLGILGPPHQRDKRDKGEEWIYDLDSWGIGYFGIDFGPDGRVTHTGGD